MTDVSTEITKLRPDSHHALTTPDSGEEAPIHGYYLQRTQEAPDQLYRYAANRYDLLDGVAERPGTTGDPHRRGLDCAASDQRA